jgi:hypothetical protein
MKHLLTKTTFLFITLVMTSATICPNYCISGSINATTNGYILNHTSNNNSCSINNWRATGFASENYLVRWILNDGGNQLVTTSQNATAPNLSINTTQSIAFVNATNTYGDDDDAGIIVGGGSNGNLPTGLSVNSFPPNQNNVSGQQLVKITTAHSTNKAAKCNQLLLIITINNEIANDGRPGITDANLRLHLFHNAQANKITFLNPGPQNKYFAFANTSSGNSFNYNNLTKLAKFDVTNNFPGNEKNIYCLVDLTEEFTSTAPEKVIFTAVLTNTADALITSTTSTDNLDVYVGSSYDPNNITVDKPTSATCGEQGAEEYIYTVTFQNVGSAAASSVFINLETDKAIDANSIQVIEAVIGNGSNLYSDNSQLFYNCNFGNNNKKFYYSKNDVKKTTPPHIGNVKPNISFSFKNIVLEGQNNPDQSTTIGHVTFKSKTKLPFKTINNRAGIFFDNNEEIITNLAVTNCLNDENATGGNSPESEGNCEKNCSNKWFSWLGWVIAGLLFMYIVVKSTRRNNQNK